MQGLFYFFFHLFTLIFNTLQQGLFAYYSIHVSGHFHLLTLPNGITNFAKQGSVLFGFGQHRASTDEVGTTATANSGL